MYSSTSKRPISQKYLLNLLCCISIKELKNYLLESGGSGIPRFDGCA